MTTFDQNKNLAFSLVTVAPVPPASGTSLTVADASPFPVAPFYALVWPPDVCSYLSNAELVRVTAVVGNVFTIDRAEGGTSAQLIAAGWQIANTVTAEIIDAIEAAINSLETNAVIINPGSSVRNTITPTGDFVALPIVGAVAQTADLLNAKVGGATNPFFRVVPGQAVGIGAGTFDPAVYGTNVISRLVLSASQANVAAGAAAIDPGTTSLIQALNVDIEAAYSGTNANAQRSALIQMRVSGAGGTSSFGSITLDASNTFAGTKASGTIQAVRSYALQSVLVYLSGATGDVTRFRGLNLSVSHQGGITGGIVSQLTGAEVLVEMQKSNVGSFAYGVNSVVQASGFAFDASTTSIPLMEALRATVIPGNRNTTSAYGLHVLPISSNVGGAVLTNSRAVYLEYNSTGVNATNPYQIYSDGGESLLNAGGATVVPLTIRGAAAQSGRLQRWQDSAAALLLGVSAAGVLEWGSAADTNLYRSAADTLKTDDSFHVGATFSHLGSALGFLNASPVAQQAASTISALWTALKNYGLLTAGSTAPASLVTSVTAGDTSIVIGGTASDPTVATNTLDVIATNHPPAADWSNNSKKITSVTDPTNAQDAATKAYVDSVAGEATSSVILLPTTDARNVIQPSAATVKLLTLKGFASQSDSLLEFQDSSGTVLGTVNPAGDYAIGSNLIASASGFLDITEITAPSTPSSNHARIYVEDDGTGLTQIVAKFQSGNTVVIAKDF